MKPIILARDKQRLTDGLYRGIEVDGAFDGLGETSEDLVEV